MMTDVPPDRRLVVVVFVCFSYTSSIVLYNDVVYSGCNGTYYVTRALCREAHIVLHIYIYSICLYKRTIILSNKQNVIRLNDCHQKRRFGTRMRCFPYRILQTTAKHSAIIYIIIMCLVLSQNIWNTFNINRVFLKCVR